MRHEVHVCSPFGVVRKKNNKLRFILDLRFLNKHLAKHKFKFEDLRVVADFLQPGDCFFTFDLWNGYHHVDIFQEQGKYLAFSFLLDKKTRYFPFCSLPFGLSHRLTFSRNYLGRLVRVGDHKGRGFLSIWMTTSALTLVKLYPLRSLT